MPQGALGPCHPAQGGVVGADLKFMERRRDLERMGIGVMIHVAIQATCRALCVILSSLGPSKGGTLTAPTLQMRKQKLRGGKSSAPQLAPEPASAVPASATFTRFIFV